MPPEDNKFINNLYHEFEQKLFKVFGFGIEDLKNVLDRPDTPEQRGHDLDAELKAAFDEGGAPQLRWQMNNVIACLEFVYMIERLDREPTYDEWADRVEELDIGMTRDDLVPFDGGE